MDLRALAKHLKTKQLDVKKVVFEFDGERWVFDSPTVLEANMMGNVVFQIFGNYSIEEEINEEDIQLIIEKTNCDRETAIKAIKKYKDIAEAILHIEQGDV